MLLLSENINNQLINSESLKMPKNIFQADNNIKKSSNKLKGLNKTINSNTYNNHIHSINNIQNNFKNRNHKIRNSVNTNENTDIRKLINLNIKTSKLNNSNDLKFLNKLGGTQISVGKLKNI